MRKTLVSFNVVLMCICVVVYFYPFLSPSCTCVTFRNPRLVRNYYILTSFTGGKWAWWLVKSCLINCFLNYFADKSVNKLLFFVFSVCRVAFLNVKACCLCSVLVMNVIYVAWLHLRIPIGKHKFSDCICLFV